MVTPQKLYKIIKCNTKNGESFASGFESWNKKTDDNNKKLSDFVTKIESIEKQASINFHIDDSKGLILRAYTAGMPTDLLSFDK